VLESGSASESESRSTLRLESDADRDTDPDSAIFMRLDARPAHEVLPRNSLHPVSRIVPKGRKRIAGGVSPRIGYCISKSSGRGESPSVPINICRPFGALYCSLIQPRAHARGSVHLNFPEQDLSIPQRL
jgi:hypothetical protein